MGAHPKEARSAGKRAGKAAKSRKKWGRSRYHLKRCPDGAIQPEQHLGLWSQGPASAPFEVALAPEGCGDVWGELWTRVTHSRPRVVCSAGRGRQRHGAERTQLVHHVDQLPIGRLICYSRPCLFILIELLLVLKCH